jgi:exosortase/archaeosortase
MAAILRYFAEAAAFLLELGALAALAWWGAVTGNGTAAKILLAVACPAAAAVVWGLFAAPRAAVRLPTAGILVVKTVVFGAATVALSFSAGASWAISFALLVVVDTAAITVIRRQTD